MKILTYLIVLMVVHSGFCQSVDSTNLVVKERYNQAFRVIDEMLSGQKKLSFKKAVLSTEKAYLGKEIDTAAFYNGIFELAKRCEHFQATNTLLYDKKDKSNVSKWGSIFKVMTDTTYYPLVGNFGMGYKPFSYDFDDFFGDKDWTKMFVSKLLTNGSGNCHSLPFLYKILAEELGVAAHLALAPNHIYIKHQSIKNGWYNTELTSAAFPIDAWIMASGYIHLDAIQNKVYMKALDDKESIAICLTDLAEGYKRRMASPDPEFILRCCNTALQYFPNYINALILKAETLKFKHDSFVKNNASRDHKETANTMFTEMQNLYVHIHELGYRQMPKEMYFKWIVELKTEREKYENRSVTGNVK
ncbi:MAG TPA: hypothetical protein VIM65_11285 [Cyclobacteriaceae bacterium]